jgi:hypothetical protein
MFHKRFTLKIRIFMSQKAVYFILGFFVLLCVVLLFAVFRQQSMITDLQKGTDVVAVPTRADGGSFPVTDLRTNEQGTHEQAPTVQPTVPAQQIVTAQIASPEQAAQSFYTYFFSRPNPLANGAYKTNPYLSDAFKDDIGSLYNNGNKPVFCPQNKRSSILIGKSQQVYDVYGYLTQVVIMDPAAGNKDLYRIIVKNDDGVWHIDDINCVR